MSQKLPLVFQIAAKFDHIHTPRSGIQTVLNIWGIGCYKATSGCSCRQRKGAMHKQEYSPLSFAIYRSQFSKFCHLVKEQEQYDEIWLTHPALGRVNMQN